MKYINKRPLLFSLAFLASVCASTSGVAADKPTPEEVKALTAKVAEWQLETFDDHGKYRGLAPKLKERRPEVNWRRNYDDLTWQMAALYVGIVEFRKIADNPEKYTDFLIEIGSRNDWELYRPNRPYHADDHAVGQFYLSLYEEFGDPDMLEPTRKHFDWILENPKTGSLVWERGTDHINRWGWCDALFMAPPVWARLAKLTGEEKYLEFMDQEFHATYDLLWDDEEKFFFRDTRFFDQREENGEKIFWSRGNGWVFGGLALMIPDLPENWEGRQFYVDLFKQMAVAVLETQRPDGTWSMGLLGSLESYPIKESTGTSFFTFGLAWGINNGLLDRATYEPVVLKAWEALETCVTPDGMLGYAQPVGASPDEVTPEMTEVYAVGAFLAAGAEVYKLLGGQ